MNSAIDLPKLREMIEAGVGEWAGRFTGPLSGSTIRISKRKAKNIDLSKSEGYSAPPSTPLKLADYDRPLLDLCKTYPDA